MNSHDAAAPVVGSPSPLAVELRTAGKTAAFVPPMAEELVHVVSTIATWQEIPMVRKIEETLGEKIPRCSVTGMEAWEEMEKKPSRERRRCRRPRNGRRLVRNRRRPHT